MPVLKEIETLFPRKNHNEGLFSFPEIRPLILAALFSRGEEINEIVLDLKCDTSIEPEFIERVYLVLVSASKGAADRGCRPASSTPVFFPTISIYSSSVTSVLCSKDMSMCWPSQISTHARASSAAARTFAPSPAFT